MQWPKKQTVLIWLDAYQDRVVQWYVGVTDANIEAERRYPWEKISKHDLMHVFRTETHTGDLTSFEFQRVIAKLGVDANAIGPALFEAFDHTETGYLGLKEACVGLVLLLALSHEERLEGVFAMLDTAETGRLTVPELSQFLQWVAPKGTPDTDISATAAMIMEQADTDHSNEITHKEFMDWPGRDTVLDWLNAYRTQVVAR